MKFVQVRGINSTNGYYFFLVKDYRIISIGNRDFTYLGSRSYFKMEGELHV